MNRKELAIISIITFLTVIVWIALSIFFAKGTPSISPAQSKQIVPLTPTFDNEIISKLSKREE